MSLIQIEWNPSRRQLRQFGAIAAFALPLAAWWITSKTSFVGWLLRGQPFTWDPGNGTVLLGALALGISAALLAAFQPEWLRLPFVGLVLITAPVGMVVGELLVGATFFLVFLPMGILFRCLGRNPLDWRFLPSQQSYWQRKTTGRDRESYFRQS